MNSPLEADTDRRVLIVGGGSGGHISPGLAVSEALGTLGVSCHVLCSERAIDSKMLQREHAIFNTVPARPFSRRPKHLIQCLRGIRRSSRQARSLLEEIPFDSVLSLGGFVAASVMPGIVAARNSPHCGFSGPIVLLNLDRVPGRANRRIARQADLVTSTVPTVEEGFASSITGLPIRRMALAPGDQRHCRMALGLDPEQDVVLVTGASQGASSLNRLMKRLMTSHAKSLRGHQVIHLTGHDQDDGLPDHYAKAGIDARVLPFLDEMGLAWGAASIAISRAGANSVGEIQANATPAILLPYPHHRDEHQRFNAEPLVDAGGACLVQDRDDDLTASRVADQLVKILGDPDRKQHMSEALAAQSRPDAAEAVASLLLAAGNVHRL